ILPSFSMPQQQLALLGREPERNCENLFVKRQAQYEVLLLFPIADPFAVGVEENPSASLRIPQIQLGRPKTILAKEFQQFGHILLERSKVGLFRRFAFWMFFNLARGLVVKLIGIILYLRGETISIER